MIHDSLVPKTHFSWQVWRSETNDPTKPLEYTYDHGIRTNRFSWAWEFWDRPANMFLLLPLMLVKGIFFCGGRRYWGTWFCNCFVQIVKRRLHYDVMKATNATWFALDRWTWNIVISGYKDCFHESLFGTCRITGCGLPPVIPKQPRVYRNPLHQ